MPLVLGARSLGCGGLPACHRNAELRGCGLAQHGRLVPGLCHHASSRDAVPRVIEELTLRCNQPLQDNDASLSIKRAHAPGRAGRVPDQGSASIGPPPYARALRARTMRACSADRPRPSIGSALGSPANFPGDAHPRQDSVFGSRTSPLTRQPTGRDASASIQASHMSATRR